MYSLNRRIDFTYRKEWHQCPLWNLVFNIVWVVHAILAMGVVLGAMKFHIALVLHPDSITWRFPSITRPSIIAWCSWSSLISDHVAVISIWRASIWSRIRSWSSSRRRWRIAVTLVVAPTSMIGLTDTLICSTSQVIHCTMIGRDLSIGPSWLRL